MKVYTSEIASSEIASDNPVHQRLYFGYYAAMDYVKGNVLEPGCGDGRGLQLLVEKADHYTGIDKIEGLIEQHKNSYPESTFLARMMPPLSDIKDASMDTVISSHVIEHIKDDRLFAAEISRVLKPGGVAIIVTPNRKMRIARNPWHIREYTKPEMEKLFKGLFSKVEVKGIAGNEKVMEYFDENKRSVNKLMRYDVLKLQYRLPGSWLRVPYDLLNRRNRKKLMDQNTKLASDIHYTDYYLSDDDDQYLDHFAVCYK